MPKGINLKEIWNLEFLFNLTSHLDNLNLQLQEKLQLIPQMLSYVHAFETKPRF